MRHVNKRAAYAPPGGTAARHFQASCGADSLGSGLLSESCKPQWEASFTFWPNITRTCDC